MKLLSLFASIFFIGATASAAKIEYGVYQNIFDKSACTFIETPESDDGPGGLSYDCPGPIAGTSIYLGTGNDWDNITVTVDGSTYDLWTQMVAAGAFAGFGNQNGTVEWVKKQVDQGQPWDAIGLIIRFSGINGDTGAANSTKLGVYRISADTMCFVGFGPQSAKQNEVARQMVTDTSKYPCLEDAAKIVEEPGIQ